MKGMRNTLRFAVPAAGLIVPLLLLALRLPGGGESLAHAQGPITIGFDMNTAGNTCPGDGVTDCTLGPIDACVELPSGGGVLTIDVFLKDLPPTSGDIGGIIAFAYGVGEKMDRAVGTVTGFTHDDPATSLLVQAPPQLGLLTDNSAWPPAPLLGWFATVVDLLSGVEYNPPFAEGVLSRLQIDTTGIPDGLYGLTLGPRPGGSRIDVVAWNSDSYCDPASPSFVGCNILDAYDAYGLIAIGQPCPVVVGGIAELPDVAGVQASRTDSPAGAYTALAGGLAAALLALTAGVWYARRRRLR
jgi:hypothetical protein